MEEKTENFIKENGKVYQVITIKREITDVELVGFKAQYEQALLNMAKDKTKIETIEAAFK